VRRELEIDMRKALVKGGHRLLYYRTEGAFRQPTSVLTLFSQVTGEIALSEELHVD
jgi:hypothetical protein